MVSMIRNVEKSKTQTDKMRIILGHGSFGRGEGHTVHVAAKDNGPEFDPQHAG